MKTLVCSNCLYVNAKSTTPSAMVYECAECKCHVPLQHQELAEVFRQLPIAIPRQHRLFVADDRRMMIMMMFYIQKGSMLAAKCEAGRHVSFSAYHTSKEMMKILRQPALPKNFHKSPMLLKIAIDAKIRYLKNTPTNHEVSEISAFQRNFYRRTRLAKRVGISFESFCNLQKLELLIHYELVSKYLSGEISMKMIIKYLHYTHQVEVVASQLWSFWYYSLQIDVRNY